MGINYHLCHSLVWLRKKTWGFCFVTRCWTKSLPSWHQFSPLALPQLVQTKCLSHHVTPVILVILGLFFSGSWKKPVAHPFRIIWRRINHHYFLGGGFKYVLFSPRKLGKIPNLTNIFQRGWNHQPVFIRYQQTSASKNKTKGSPAFIVQEINLFPPWIFKKPRLS